MVEQMNVRCSVRVVCGLYSMRGCVCCMWRNKVVRATQGKGGAAQPLETMNARTPAIVGW